MRPDDLFQSDSSDIEAPPRFRREILEDFLTGKGVLGGPIDAADILVRLAHVEFEGYGTHGKQRIRDDEDANLLLRATKVACQRARIPLPELPFRDFTSFYNYWKREGMSYSWAARREYLGDALRNTEEAIERLQERRFVDGLAVPASPKGRTGWDDVDIEIEDVRQKFEVARSPQDYSAVGNACVRLIEALADAALDPTKHVPAGSSIPPRDKTKERLSMVVMATLAGQDAEAMRKLVNTSIEFAHKVKHRPTPDRRSAGVAADASILLANLVRRILT